MTAPLTPESRRFAGYLEAVFDDIDWPGERPDPIVRLAAIEAAALARYAEGLVERVARNLAGQSRRIDGKGWDEWGEPTRDNYRSEARRLLAIPEATPTYRADECCSGCEEPSGHRAIPEAQEADR